jgi:hypothetical protein
VETVEQGLHAGIAIEIDVGVRMAVAGQELFDSKGVRIVARSDEHGIAEPVGDQLHAAEDEGSHEDVAQLAGGLHQRQQIPAGDLDDFARLARAHAEEPPAAGEHIGFAGELTPSMDGHQLLGGAGPPDDLDVARGNDEEPLALIAGLGEHLTVRDVPCPSVRRDARDLLRGQRGKHMIDVRGDGERDGRSGHWVGAFERSNRRRVAAPDALRIS